MRPRFAPSNRWGSRALFLLVSSLLFIGGRVKSEGTDTRPKWLVACETTSLARSRLSRAEDPIPEVIITMLDGLETIGASVTDLSIMPFDFSRMRYERTFIAPTEIFKTGEVRGFSAKPTAVRVFDGKLDEKSMKELRSLLPKLPETGIRLPPEGRRLVVQVPQQGRYRVTVIDLANPSNDEMELMKLTRCRARIWVPEIKAAGFWGTHGRDGGFLLPLPDGKSLLTGAGHLPLQVWDMTTHELLREIPLPHDIEAEFGAFSPDGNLLAVSNEFGVNAGVFKVATWELNRDLRPEQRQNGYNSQGLPSYRGFSFDRPLFTADSRYLLSLSDAPFPRCLKTASWDQVDNNGEIPLDVLRYVRAPSGKLAVLLRKNHELSLWDLARQRDIFSLGSKVTNIFAAFSPDESQIAMEIGHPNNNGCSDYNLSIWDVKAGAILKSLRPYETDIPIRNPHGLLWSPDGYYIFATVDESGLGSGIGIWNVSTGRHHGQLTGNGGYNSIFFGPSQRELWAGNGFAIQYWDLAQVLKTVRDFEDSLGKKAISDTH